VHGFSILQRDDAQVLVHLFHKAPVPDATVFLYFRELRVSQNILAPLALDTGPLAAEYIFLEVAGGLHGLDDTVPDEAKSEDDAPPRRNPATARKRRSPRRRSAVVLRLLC